MDNERPLVLMVEDDADITILNKKWLEVAGYETISAETLAEARLLLKTRSPDVIILDILLQDGNGLDFFTELRQNSSAPVLFLTAQAKPEERLAGLVSGGNDYITKPYDIAELSVRVKNFITLKQNAGRPVENVVYGSLRLDIISGLAYLNGVDINLSAKEFALLQVFVSNREKAMDIDYLYKRVWGNQGGAEAGVGAVRTAVSRLRVKLEDSEFMIIARRGAGYSFIKE